MFEQSKKLFLIVIIYTQLYVLKNAIKLYRDTH